MAEVAEDAAGLMAENTTTSRPSTGKSSRLKFHGGLSYREIAEVMGITSTNVGFILHTAISKLRQRMVKTT